MRPLVIILLLILFSISFVQSQPQKNNSQEKMKSLNFLAGEWQGEGWISFGPNQTHQFNETEKIQYKLDGSILMIEGKGIDKNSSPELQKIIYNAFAIINYDNQSNKYLIRAYKSNGQFVDADVEVGENSLVWGFEISQGKVKYIIKINEKGQWYEVGEFSRDGESWFKNFEMTLTKKE